MEKRELHRSVLAKLYKTIDEWPVEDRQDWITLRIDEIHYLYTHARNESLKDLYKRFGFENKKKFIAGRPSSKSS